MISHGVADDPIVFPSGVDMAIEVAPTTVPPAKGRYAGDLVPPTMAQLPDPSERN